MAKKILGLDLGTNSIGWALIDKEAEKIVGMGSRIIPMSQEILGAFGEGNSVSQTAERTRFRSVRRLRERNLLRRERLHRVLNVLGFLPEHYAKEIDFHKHYGQFLEETEPKLVWKKNGKKSNGKDQFEFLFPELFAEMLNDFKTHQPDLLNRRNRNGEDVKIPYDWTIYYLRKKALEKAISMEQLAWLILNFNQKRGYYQLRGEEEDTNADNKKEFVVLLKINKVEKGEIDKKNDKKTWHTITFDNGWVHNFPFTTEPNWLNTEREFLVVEEYDDEGNIKIVKDKKKDKEGREKRTISPLPSFEEIDSMSKNDQDKIYKKIKTRTEITITNSNKTVGTYIYDTLLQKPTQKIRGKLVRTIERKFYKEELSAILKKQIELQPDLFTDELYNDCVRELYRSNEAHQLQLSKRDFLHLFIDDIIFYQRPLRSQKSSIGNCSLEYKKYKDKDGKEVKEYLKAIPKSNPYYQEFRVWQWLYNLKIYQKENDKEETDVFITDINIDRNKHLKDIESLFTFLMTQKEVNHKDVLEFLITPTIEKKYQDAKPKALKDAIAKELSKYRWNYVFDDSKDKEEDKSKTYPMNETGYEIRRRLEKVENVPANFLTTEIEYQLWHIIYSVTDKKQYDAAIENFVKRYNQKHKTNIDEKSFIAKEAFGGAYWKEKNYGSYSEKAIKKLLPLMRIGKYWNWERIDNKVKSRIDKILTGEYDEAIKDRVREKTICLTEQHHFQGLQLWLTQYIVYDRHSEAALAGKWESVTDLEKYLKDFKQHSLRNPIVEQIVTETLRVVKDIWDKYGNGAKDYFDEIHIELGREMKNTAEDRKAITNQVTDNENTNLRIKALIVELKNDTSIINVRPFSPSQQEILKIYEEGVLSSIKNKTYQESDKAKKEEDDAMLKIGTTAQPSKTELTRYKLWLEQKYKSPYTGEIISLSKLFTTEYQIEHIIPQSRYFDDSLSNKVICEAAVNQLKDKQLGLEFIKNHSGEKVETGFGNTIQIFTEEKYKEFVKEHYDKNRSKKTKLLLEDIPDKMIARQMNDTRYISKFISNLLSNIVRIDEDRAKKIISDAEIVARKEADKEKADEIRRLAKSAATDDGINSKNIIPGNGKITSTLRNDWGLNDVWNELILPRFERMNQLTNSTSFTSTNSNGKIIPTVPLELSKGFQKKRIDHRHHALDALVIACATRDHVNLLNNQSAKSDNSRYDLQNKLRNKEQWKDKEGKTRDKFTTFKKPWDNFTKDTKEKLETIVVSFKQNLRVINKATNYYEKFENGKKVVKKQEGVNWAIRKPLHKETVSGKVELLHTKTPKGKIITATRKAINTSFNSDTIKSITDTGIQKILKNHLANKNENPEIAFTPEGIDEMNRGIKQLNDGKPHQPIYKVRVFESGSKFQLGETGNKKDKYVEAAKGTNLFFVVYERKDTKARMFDTVPLNEVIEHQKQQVSEEIPKANRTTVPIKRTLEDRGKEIEVNYLFHLSPNDLVYVPTEEEKGNEKTIDFKNLTKEQRKRTYKFTDGSGSMANFIPVNIAEVLFNLNKDKQKKAGVNFPIQNEIGVGSQGSKNERAITGEQIKSVCIKLQADRLGNIKQASLKASYAIPQSTIMKVNEPTPTFGKVSIGSMEQADEQMLMHTANMSPEERMAYLQKLREISRDTNLSEEAVKNNFSKIKINPTDENS